MAATVVREAINRGSKLGFRALTQLACLVPVAFSPSAEVLGRVELAPVHHHWIRRQRMLARDGVLLEEALHEGVRAPGVVIGKIDVDEPCDMGRAQCRDLLQRRGDRVGTAVRGELDEGELLDEMAFLSAHVAADHLQLIPDRTASLRGRLHVRGQSPIAAVRDRKGPVEADERLSHAIPHRCGARTIPAIGQNPPVTRYSTLVAFADTDVPSSRFEAPRYEVSMTTDEAYDVLGIEPGATEAAVKAAYYMRLIPSASPDSDSDFAVDRAVVEQAHQLVLEHRIERERPEAISSAEPAGTAVEATPPDPIAIVRDFMERESIVILFDGTICAGNGPRLAANPADVPAWLASTPSIPLKRMITLIMLELRRKRVKLALGDIKRAIAKIVWDDQKDRHNFIVAPFVETVPDPALVAAAEVHWQRLVSKTMVIDVGLGVAVLKHFIWQVKQKLLNRSVQQHLMPIISSPVQGGGKSTFVEKFLSPLQELATDPTSLADFADRRSADLYRFPVVYIDDVDPVSRDAVSTLKSLMSNRAVRGRILGTSDSDTREQRSTLIGTSNESIGALIEDPTGHRRFIALPFRNGNEATGGDPMVWQVVEETDYDLLWRSVNAFGPSPIMPFSVALALAQAAQAPVDRLREWLCAQDFTSDAFDAIRLRSGIRADELRRRYNDETGDDLSNKQFSDRMAYLVEDAAVPLKARFRVSNCRIYPLKPRPLDPTGSPEKA